MKPVLKRSASIFEYSQLEHSKLNPYLSLAEKNRSSSIPNLKRHRLSMSELNNAVVSKIPPINQKKRFLPRLKDEKKKPMYYLLEEQKQILINRSSLNQLKQFKAFYLNYVTNTYNQIEKRRYFAEICISELSQDLITPFKKDIELLSIRKEKLEQELKNQQRVLDLALGRVENAKYSNKLLQSTITKYADYRTFMKAIKLKKEVKKKKKKFKSKFSFVNRSIRDRGSIDGLAVAKGVTKILAEDKEMEEPVFDNDDSMMEILKDMEKNTLVLLKKYDDLKQSEDSKKKRLALSIEDREEVEDRDGLLIERLEREKAVLLENNRELLAEKQMIQNREEFCLVDTVLGQIEEVFLLCLKNRELTGMNRPVYVEYLGDTASKKENVFGMLSYMEKYCFSLTELVFRRKLTDSRVWVEEKRLDREKKQEAAKRKKIKDEKKKEERFNEWATKASKLVVKMRSRSLKFPRTHKAKKEIEKVLSRKNSVINF